MSAPYKEEYRKGNDLINYVVYDSTTVAGQDEVLQYKLLGKIEMAHITLHPDGTVNFRVERGRELLETAVRNNLAGFTPEISDRVKQFLNKVKPKI